MIHNDDTNLRATLVADLASQDVLDEALFRLRHLHTDPAVDHDVRGAIAAIFRVLKSGGAVLPTVPCITQINGENMELTGDYWRFTDAYVRRLFSEFFPANQTKVIAYGNVLAAMSFLQGLAAEGLKESELVHFDRKYQVLVSVRAIKPLEQ